MRHERLWVLGLALALDAAVGDPRSRWHPVALFGGCVGWLMARAPGQGQVRQLVYGALVAGLAVGSTTVLTRSALVLARRHGRFVAVVSSAVLLKTSLAYRQLEEEARAVERQLSAGRLDQARRALGALVSRDCATLDESQVASAVVESLAENLSDSFIGPLVYFVAAGVPGAIAYRAVNTLDAMVGYHGRYEYLGRVAARLDDAANLVPSRLAALAFILGPMFRGESPRRALGCAIRDHGRTESPNAGWPMAAMAGALGVELEKPEHYRLGSEWPPCQPVHVDRALGQLRIAAAAAALAAMAIVGLAQRARGVPERRG
jgi:adenosylcobinamide-phosphate synthase